MGFRFRQSVRLAKGVRVNLAKKSASLSLGGKGLTYNIGRRGGRTTIGLLSYQTARRPIPWGWLILAGIVVVIVMAVVGFPIP